MKVVDLSLFPTSIDVTLYRYNYLDNKLWTQLKNQVDYIEVDQNSIIVTNSQLEAIIAANYSDEINKIKSTGSKFFHTQVNSIYFIWAMVQEMSNLQFVKLTRSLDKDYTRMLNTAEDEKTIEFDFKLLSITIKLAEIFNTEEVAVINEALYQLGILDRGEPYTRLKAVEVIGALDDLINALEDEILSERVGVLSELLEVFTFKIERDNPLTLLVTDY